MHHRFTLLLVTCLALITRATAQPPVSLLYSLTNPDTNGHSLSFGGDVAITTNFAVAGSGRPYQDSYPAPGGPVTVYNPTNGAVLYTLLNPGQHSPFGSCVTVSGTRVFVGDYDYHPLFSQGCVYVYDLAGVKPTLPILQLFPPQVLSVAASGNYLAVRARFCICVFDLSSSTPNSWVVAIPTDPNGGSLAISGTRVVVGTPGSQNTNGSVSVYDLASATPTTPVATLRSPSPHNYDQFGSSVAIAGVRAAVIGGTNVYVYNLASMTPNDPVLEIPRGGTSLAMFGARLVVGSPGNPYVYDLASATPSVPVATLTNPSPAAGEWFGQPVAISGSHVIVGAPGINTNAGSAYLFDVPGAQPAVPVARLASGPAPTSSSGGGYGFGRGVAISGTRVIVAAPPSAYVYDLAGATPIVPITKLYNPVAGFDRSVAISGSRAVVGAYGANTVYVYDVTRSRPEVPIFVLDNPGAAPASFGLSVGISGTRVAVGAPDAGRTYVYDLANPTPTQPTVTLSNPGPSAGFGRAIAISGTRLVVGASPYGYTNSGAYVYDLTTTPPSVLTLIEPASRPSGMFGASVAISGTRVVVGAYMPYADPGYSSERAHIYDLAGDTPAVAVATLLNPNPPNYPGFGYPVAISGTRVVVSSVWGEGESATGKAYLYDIAGDTPTVPIATLSNPMLMGYLRSNSYNVLALYDTFARSVAADGMTVVVGSTEPPESGAAFVFGPRPRLTIAPASTNSATISWAPSNSPEFFLQSANNLAPTNWVNAPSGTPNPVTILLTNQSRFYRLLSP